MSIRIMLADDHAVIRHGLSQALQQEEDLVVVGYAGDGPSAVKKARELRPDIVVMDINMPNLNGIEATREIQREAPDVKVIALSMCSAKTCVQESLRAGAFAYLLKNCEFGELMHAIRTVAAGRTYLSPALGNVAEEEPARPEGKSVPTAFSVLTPREREILQRMAEGGTTKQIALQLRISPKTVEAHRQRIMDKLKIDAVAQLTKYAIREGLTSVEF